jgi:hypothetical protein
MPRRRPKFQTRLSRSDRMRSATVKQVRAAQPDDAGPMRRSRSGVEYVGPSPATDAVIAHSTGGPLRYGLREVAWLIGIMTLVAVVIAVAMIQADQAGTDNSRLVTVALIIGATTVGLAVLIVLRRWHQGRMAFIRLAPEQRRLSRTTGTIRVQERLNLVNAREYWLRAPGSAWMNIDLQTFEQIEPVLVATQRNDLNFQRQTGNDVSRDWAIPDATILYHGHPHSGTVVEIHDADGNLVYRHPRYDPDE